MAVDWIARLLAMARGSSDAYTKAETDALLADKADLANGKIPAAQLPSYVDDTIEGYLYNGAWYEDAQHTAEVTGESGKIYVDLVTNRTYRWSGSAFVEISESLALGETSSTAYAGNKGKANADAIAAMKDGQGIDSFADVETALATKLNTADVDAAISSTSTNPVQNKAVYEALATKISLRDVLGYGTVIPASTEENPQDLDTYASMGVFTIESSAVAATIDNAPVVFPGRLFVFAGAVAGANIQVYITGENLYIRRRTATLEWKPWVSMI